MTLASILLAAVLTRPVKVAASTPASLPIVGEASWYGSECARKPMANGKRFNPRALTAASYLFALGTKLRVTNLKNGKQVDVIVTDRGPNRRLGRVVDLSQRAATVLGFRRSGTTQVSIWVMRYAPAN